MATASLPPQNKIYELLICYLNHCGYDISELEDLKDGICFGLSLTYGAMALNDKTTWWKQVIAEITSKEIDWHNPSAVEEALNAPVVEPSLQSWGA